MRYRWSKSRQRIAQKTHFDTRKMMNPPKSDGSEPLAGAQIRGRTRAGINGAHGGEKR